MSIDEKKIADFLDAMPKIGDDKNFKSNLMVAFCRLMNRYREILPINLEQYVELASAYWGRGEGSAQEIEDARVECWNFLDGKGHVTGIASAEDAAVRALICLLYHKSKDEDQVADTAEFFLASIRRIKANDPCADEIIDQLIGSWKKN